MMMKTLTIWQPWAHLKVVGVKRFETRSWATSYRGPMAIHAAAKPISAIEREVGPELLQWIQRKVLFEQLEELTLGAVVGMGDLVACHPITEAFVAALDERQRRLGDFTLGRYAWDFEDMHALDTPVPAKGGQRIWNWEGE